MSESEAYIESERKNREQTDEELAAAYQSGDSSAADRIIERYKPTVRILARQLYLVGGDRDDLLQEGMVGLFKAIQTFDPEHESSFRHYAEVLISRQLYSAIVTSRRLKHQPLNESISLNVLEENQQEDQLLDRMGSVDSPEQILIDREAAESASQKVLAVLSPMEKRVLEFYLKGMDYHAIAEEMGKSPKSIDNALQRIRTKAARVLQ